MINKLTFWITIFLMISVIVFPIIYTFFSLWWLLTGDMVTRLTYFSTSFLTTACMLTIFILFSLRKRIPYRGENNYPTTLKKIYQKFTQN
jgi:hypothetical protein